MLEEFCREHAGLSEGDIAALAEMAAHLPYFSKLTDSDIFIDCFSRDGNKCLVVAEARPSGGVSLYREPVIGKVVLPDKEPAVFNALHTRAPARDVLGVTQENRTVRQVAIPIKNASDQVIGVLIQEKDISDSLNRERKYDALAKITEEQKELLSRFDSGGAPHPSTEENSRLVMKEVHHRVKNSLQLVASILNLQSRETPDPAVRTAFKENVGRILGIAAIHDILSLGAVEPDFAGQTLSLLAVLRVICRNVAAYSAGGECAIDIRIGGDDFPVKGDKATHICLVVNELLTNAIKHAFAGRKAGAIDVAVTRGNRYSSISIADDGVGFAAGGKGREGLGMNIVYSLVREKLGGTLRLESGDTGSNTIFDFKN